MSAYTDAQIERARSIAVALEQQVARVLEIHTPGNEFPSGVRLCRGCYNVHPCETRRVLEGES